jgi:hypothetical protein
MQTVANIRIIDPAVIAAVARIKSKTGETTVTGCAQRLILERAAQIEVGTTDMHVAKLTRSRRKKNRAA